MQGLAVRPQRLVMPPTVLVRRGQVDVRLWGLGLQAGGGQGRAGGRAEGGQGRERG